MGNICLQEWFLILPVFMDTSVLTEIVPSFLFPPVNSGLSVSLQTPGRPHIITQGKHLGGHKTEGKWRLKEFNSEIPSESIKEVKNRGTCD